MNRSKVLTKENLAGELARLSELDRAELVERWRDLYGSNPPANISRSLMRYAIAYRMQEKVLGGLKPSTRRFLAKVVSDVTQGKAVPLASPTIKAGTRLIREWHGTTYEATIIENGVMFQGKRYRSLSEVARIITGVKWSGHLFFGLKTREDA